MTDPTQSYIVGIAGGTASGKSTLTRRLAELLPDLRVKTVGQDSYYKSEKPTVIAPITRVVYPEHNHPDAWDLPRLRRDLEAWSRGDGGPFDVVIVEGVLILWDDEVRSMLDLKVFVDCQADERIVRRVKRHMEWGETYEAITSRYLDTVRYRHDEYVEPTKWHADLILNGSSPSETSLSVLTEWIRNRAAGRKTR